MRRRDVVCHLEARKSFQAINNVYTVHQRLRIYAVKAMLVYENRASKMKFFGIKDFALNLNLKNGCKNEFKDNKKSCS